MIQYNGLNVQRRRQYVKNPRNNLVSTVSFVWENSIQQHDTPRLLLEERKSKEHRQISQQYNVRIENKLQETINLGNSQQFRVFVPQSDDDSLSRQLRNYNSKSNYSSLPAQEKPLNSLASRKSSLGETVFGYSIDKTPKKESYLHRAIAERLRPNQHAEGQHSKHQAFTINQPINLDY